MNNDAIERDVAQEGADGMTNEEVETLRAENRHLINQLNLSRTGKAKLQVQVADLETAHFREVAELTEKLEMERKAYSVLAASVKSDPDSSIKEKLFFACALLNGIGDTEGRDYYDALVAALGLNEAFKKWKEGKK